VWHALHADTLRVISGLLTNALCTLSTSRFRISYGPDLDPPLRGNVIEERNSMFCFAPSGHGACMKPAAALSAAC
jgi:hypothetical protein